MIKDIPENWIYDKSMEMLFLFYQVTDELLSERTPDSYALPLHNVITLAHEMEEVYILLKRNNIIDTYYNNYIPPIIDEFIYNIENDSIFKKICGRRLSSIKTGFQEAKNNHVLLQRWLGSFTQACPLSKYINEYKNQIIHYVINNDKRKYDFIYLVKNYYITLRHSGYSKEFLYTSSKKFFSNDNIKIENSECIKIFLDYFDGKIKKINFLLLMNTESIDYIDNISNDLYKNINIKKVSNIEQRASLCSEKCVNDLFEEYDRLSRKAKKHEKVEVVRYECIAIEPYQAAKHFVEFIDTLQTLKLYFLHFYSAKQIYRFLLQSEEGKYKNFVLPRRLHKRPYINIYLIKSRIKNILSAKAMTLQTIKSLADAINMHAEAINSKSNETLIRTFWTALETLFFNSNTTIRENVIHSIISIIQKTYLLKITRVLYKQIIYTLSKKDRRSIGLDSYQAFLTFFCNNDENSDMMKKLYILLNNNILLRTRLFFIRKKLATGNSILKTLTEHEQKINWQLSRLYRIRNIATHLGQESYGLSTAINHLHNYFDYIVNYVLCKSENNDIIIDMQTLVFETKNDNKIHRELLKSNDPLSETNYIEFLFWRRPELNKLSI